MKSINSFIIERLKLSKDKPVIRYIPKDIFALKSILKKRLAENKNANLNDIDVSNITTFCDTTKGKYKDEGLFEKLDPYNIKIDSWKTDQITDFRRAFFNCHNLDCDLSNWKISNSPELSNMFYECYNFKGTGLDSWDVSENENFFGMFVQCRSLTVDLSKWKLDSATSIAHMFNGCINFDCDLSEWGNYIDKNKIIESHFMFEKCTILKQKKLIPDWYYKL